jgi:DNA-binding SARP family transcriptional activator
LRQRRPRLLALGGSLTAPTATLCEPHVSEYRLLRKGDQVAALRIELLGGFRVAVGTSTVPEASWARRRAAAVLKLLALAPGHRLQREHVMDVLWRDLDPAAAAANLRKAVHYARRALGTDATRLLVSAGELLCLSPADVWVDVDAFRAAVARGRRAGAPEAYTEALELYGEGLLPEDRYEEWAIERREELRLEFVAVLEELVGMLEARGEIEGATRAVRRLVAEEPLREEHHARLIRLHALAGRRGEALREYERLRASLAEVGGEPSAETQQLYEEVRANQAAEPELGAELWERVGDLRVLAGDTAGAAKAFGLALPLLAGTQAEARLQRKTASAWLMQQAADAADPHLAAAEKLAREPAERGRLGCLRATQAWQRGELERAGQLALVARELAEAHAEADDIAAADEALAIVSHLRGDWRQGLQLEIERSAGESERRAILARVCDIHHCIGQYHLYGDGLADDVEDYARRTLALAGEAEAVRAQAFAWCLLGESLLLHARGDEAAGCLERSCELLSSLGKAGTGLPWQRLAELAVCRGRVEDAEPPLRRAAAIATVSPMARHLWGRVHATATFAALERGDPEAAIRSVRAADASAARYGDCPTCSALLNPMAAEAFAAVGDRQSARGYAESALRVAGLFESSAWRAMAESASASVAAAEGDSAQARERFAAAARLYQRAQQPYWSQRSLAQAAAS